MMKRWMAALLAMMMLCACACAETVSVGLEFDYDDYYDGYEVVGRGTCTDEVIVIPNEHEGEPVTGISYHAFEQDEQLKKLILPDTLVHLWTEPIYGCKNLEYYEQDGARYLESATNPVMLLRSLTDKEAKEFVVPEQTKLIYETAFEQCSALESVTLPDSLVYIGGRAFMGCTSLKEITIPAGVDFIYDRLFYACTGLEKVTLLAEDCYLDDWAFIECTSLKEISLQPGFTMDIPCCEQLFAGCTSLTDIYFNGPQGQFYNNVYGDKIVVCNTVTVHCTDGDFTLEP